VSDPIKTGTRPDGTTYYWFRVEAGWNAGGKRVQVYRSAAKKKDLKAVLVHPARLASSATGERHDGTCSPRARPGLTN